MPAPGWARSIGWFFRYVVIVLLLLGFVPLLGVTSARLLGGDRWPIAQLAPFAPLAGACWLAALVILLALRAWWISAFAGVLVAVHVFWLAPGVLANLASDPVPDGTPWRVLTINTQFGGADIGELSRLVHDEDVDLVAVQEMTPEFEERFTAAVKDQLPNRVAFTSPDSAGGSGIWSRGVLTSEGVLPAQFKMPKVMATVPGAGSVEVIGVHTLSPLRVRIPGWKKDLAMLAAQARAGTGPRIMLGDFNATRDHAPFRKLISGPMIDAADAAVLLPWEGQTWPNDRRFVPPVVRLDHVLVTKNDFSVNGLRTISINGTDHRAVLVNLLVRDASS